MSVLPFRQEPDNLTKLRRAYRDRVALRPDLAGALDRILEDATIKLAAVGVQDATADDQQHETQLAVRPPWPNASTLTDTLYVWISRRSRTWRCSRLAMLVPELETWTLEVLGLTVRELVNHLSGDAAVPATITVRITSRGRRCEYAVLRVETDVARARVVLQRDTGWMLRPGFGTAHLSDPMIEGLRSLADRSPIAIDASTLEPPSKTT